MKRREATATVTSTSPRCLHLRRVPAIWGDHDEDHVAARMRWQAAAARVGVATGGTRFNWHLTVSETEVDRLLWTHGLTRDELPELAAEARAAFGDLFSRSWATEHREDIDDRERVARLVNLTP